ncbi:hypothetical protein C7S17_6174 [Burkholderia thailandensis]|nr:hypothetical protein [Burkholderia thailandensis]
MTGALTLSDIRAAIEREPPAYRNAETAPSRAIAPPAQHPSPPA